MKLEGGEKKGERGTEMVKPNHYLTWKFPLSTILSPRLQCPMVMSFTEYCLADIFNAFYMYYHINCRYTVYMCITSGGYHYCPPFITKAISVKELYNLPSVHIVIS